MLQHRRSFHFRYSEVNRSALTPYLTDHHCEVSCRCEPGLQWPLCLLNSGMSLAGDEQLRSLH